MLDRQLAAPEVVVDDDVHVGERKVAPYDGDRHRAGRGRDQLRGKTGPGQDDAVRAELEELLQRLRLGVAVAIPGRDQDAIAAGGRGQVEPVQHVGEEEVVEVGDHHPDVEGAALDEASGDGVGPVAKRFGGREHRLPAGGAHGPLTAHHARDQGLGDARSLGHVHDGRRPGGMEATGLPGRLRDGAEA